MRLSGNRALADNDDAVVCCACTQRQRSRDAKPESVLHVIPPIAEKRPSVAPAGRQLMPTFTPSSIIAGT
jgi:hypothetical protein